MGTNTGQVMTLANSIIGVSVLAMPFCFKQCGVVLSVLLLCLSSVLSRFTCHFLLKAAIITRRRNYEFLAFHVFGSSGKLGVELAIIGFLLGTCIAFFVVMGDLGPAIISSMFGLHSSDTLRTSILFCMALFVVLPLGLLRNVDSLSSLCTASFAFYLCLVLKVMGEATSTMVSGDWLSQVNFWRPEGILQCLPIFSMALFCQTQLFEIFDSVPNSTLEKLNAVVRVAINMCTAVYIFVGFFGYIAFCKENITGNILVSLSQTMSSEVIKLGFVLSVAVSFPLVIFPCRASLYSLLYRSAQPPVHDLGTSHVPEGKFKLLTFGIVGISFIVGLVLPNIERVLGIIGSTIGVTICIITPSLLLGSTARHPKDKLVSQVVLWSGAVIMVLGTYAHILNVGNAVGVDSGLEHAASKILDHAVDRLNERQSNEKGFRPGENSDSLKKFIESQVDSAVAHQSLSESEVKKKSVPASFDSVPQMSSLLKNDRVVPISSKHKDLNDEIPAHVEEEEKPLKLDGKRQEPADTGEKQQEPPAPVEAVMKPASAEPAIKNSNAILKEGKPSKRKMKKKEQPSPLKNITAAVQNSEQVNQDAIRHEDAESALEAKAGRESEKGIVSNKQNELEEQKKKAEEQKLIETLKEHQEVQRDMLNEQQRILQELKKHEKVKQKTVNEVPNMSPSLPQHPQNQDNEIIPNALLLRNSGNEKSIPIKSNLDEKVPILSKVNLSLPPINQLQLPSEGKAPLPIPKKPNFGKGAAIVPLPLAYSAKVSVSPSSKPLHESVESKPAARDILGSEAPHSDREKRDLSLNNPNSDLGAHDFDEPNYEANDGKSLFVAVSKKECKQSSRNILPETLPNQNSSEHVSSKQNSDNVTVGQKGQDFSIKISDDLKRGVQNLLAQKSVHLLHSLAPPSMELKTPSSISEPKVEIGGDQQKLSGQAIPVLSMHHTKSVQSKERQ